MRHISGFQALTDNFDTFHNGYIKRNLKKIKAYSGYIVHIRHISGIQALTDNFDVPIFVQKKIFYF